MEFQAVVMAAGRGSRMMEITSGCPKFLLPVGNLPLIFYPLYTLKQAGFQEAIVIVPETAKTKSLNDALSGRLDMKLDIVSIPSQEEWGTADSLRFIKSKIKVAKLLGIGNDLLDENLSMGDYECSRILYNIQLCKNILAFQLSLY